MKFDMEIMEICQENPNLVKIEQKAPTWQIFMKFYVQTCMENCQENPYLVKIGQKAPTRQIFMKFDMETFMEISQENPNLVKIRQKYQALYMKIYICFVVLTGTYVAQQYRE